MRSASRLLTAGKDERGVTAVIVAIMLVVLFGAAALAFDVGLMYEERRELQRTADVAAHSGAQRLIDGQPAAFGTAEFYIDENPSQNHLEYDPANDTINASMSCTGIPGFTNPIPCVEVTVETPDFPLTFARILGFNETRIDAEATAVWASATPSGLKLVPWTIIDCPDQFGNTKIPGTNEALYWDEAVAPRDVMEARNAAQCPYDFDVTWQPVNGQGAQLYLFDGESGNLQGVQLRGETQQGCLEFDDVYFGQAGGNSTYRDTLSQNEASCPVDRGARVSTQTGSVQRNTYESVAARIATWDHNEDFGGSCMNSDAFAATVTPVSRNRVTFVNEYEDNPCLMAVMFVVHSNPAVASLATSQTYRGGDNFPNNLRSLMHPTVVPAEGDMDDGRFEGRFAPLSNGASNPMVVRRFAYFYLTSNPDPATARGPDGEAAPWTGFFMKSQDGLDAEISDSPCFETDGTCVVKYVYNE